MGLFVSNLVHGVLNGVELELVYNFFITCSIAENLRLKSNIALKFEYQKVVILVLLFNSYLLSHYVIFLTVGLLEHLLLILCFCSVIRLFTLQSYAHKHLSVSLDLFYHFSGNF